MSEPSEMASPDNRQDVTCSEREEARRIIAAQRLDHYRQRLNDAAESDERDVVHDTIADELAADHSGLACCAAAVLGTRLRPPEDSYAWRTLAALRDSDPSTASSNTRGGGEAAACLRLIAQVAAHWGAGVLARYGWTSRARSFLERLWAVADAHPDWTTAVRHLNAVLVLRHQLVLSGVLSASTRSWQTIGNEVDVWKGAPRRCSSPVTAADLKNVLDWARQGFIQHGGIMLRSLEEAERSVTHWTTSTAETIQLWDGTYLSQRPPSLWAKCMIAYDSAGLIVPEDTLHRPPQRYPSDLSRSAKRPRLDGAMTPLSVAGGQAWRTTSTSEHSQDQTCSPTSPLAATSLGSGSRLSSIDSEPEAGSLENTNFSSPSSEEALDHLSDEATPATRASFTAEQSMPSGSSVYDTDVISDGAITSTPQSSGTEHTHFSPTSSADQTDPRGGECEDETEAQTPYLSNDPDIRSPDCPLCQGRCIAGFVPRTLCHEEDGSQESSHHVSQRRKRDFEQIHAMSELVSERSALDAKAQALRAWASPVRLASVFDPDEISTSTASKEDADVWSLTSQRVEEYTNSGIIFDRPILIKNAVRDAGWRTWTECQAALRRKLAGHALQVRNPSTHLLEDVDGDDFLEMLTAPDAALTALDLPGLVRGDKPAFALLPRYRLLEDLVYSEAWDDARKQVTTKELDIFGCICFNILGLCGAFSGAHLDSLNGTWVRSFCGRKAWMFIPPAELGSDDLRRLASDGDDFDPRGKARTIIIHPDEVLLMPAGEMIVHAVLTLETSLMDGGMVWDELRVKQILDNMLWIGNNQQATNEPWPNHIQAIVKQLDRAVVLDTTRFARAVQSDETFLAEYEQCSREIHALRCTCASRCSRFCPCKVSRRRCTPECSSHVGRVLTCLKEM